jgi:hypothetical protein
VIVQQNIQKYVKDIFLALSLIQYIIKGTLTRDFRPPVFFYQTTPPRPLTHGVKPFSIWISIRRENGLCNRQFFDKNDL